MFAVTEAELLRVNVQDLVLLPPLEQAPDQTASRLFVTRSVIAAPTLNAADIVDGTDALIPEGVELTVSPLRPVAVTVSVAVWGGGGGGGPGGLIVRVVVLVTPPAVAVIVAVAAAVTVVVAIENTAD